MQKRFLRRLILEACWARDRATFGTNEVLFRKALYKPALVSGFLGLLSSFWMIRSDCD